MANFQPVAGHFGTLLHLNTFGIGMKITICSRLLIVTTLFLGMACQTLNGETRMSVTETVVKLTYFGPQNKTVASLLFSVAGMNIPIDTFKALDVFYGNDETLITIAYVNVDTLSHIIEVSKQFATDEARGETSPIELRVAIVNVNTNELQHLELDRSTASEFYQNLHAVLPQDSDVWEAVRIWGSRTGFSAHSTSD